MFANKKLTLPSHMPYLRIAQSDVNSNLLFLNISASYEWIFLKQTVLIFLKYYSASLFILVFLPPAEIISHGGALSPTTKHSLSHCGT